MARAASERMVAEGRDVRGTRRRLAAMLLAVLAFGSVFLAASRVAQAHSGDFMDSAWAATVPTIDGAMSAGEWADAERVDLGAIPGNYMAASLLIKNNATFVWVAYDATGDTSVSPEDSASFALDTGHDGVPTNGGEDQFVMGGWVPGGTTAHLVYSSSNGTWVVQDSPFNPSL